MRIATLAALFLFSAASIATGACGGSVTSVPGTGTGTGTGTGSGSGSASGSGSGSGSGDGACTGTPPPCMGCDGPVPAGCVEIVMNGTGGGAWQCPLTVCPADAGARGPFACASTTCSAGSYCHIISGGVAVPDGGSSTNGMCIPIPAGCGDPATCACIAASSQTCDDQCSVDSAGNVTINCFAP